METTFSLKSTLSLKFSKSSTHLGNDALVVKLLGKSLGYNTMKERLQKIWKLQGGFDIMDNDNGFYMVKFDQAADKEKVITGGPWLIFDHCLAVTHWTP